jgi:hypothetical protein
VSFSTFAKNLMLDALDESATNGIKFWSAHTAYSTTGTNEVAGGSPAYARKAATFAAASASSKVSTGSPAATFDIPAGTTVAWIGRWDASTAGNFHGMSPAGGGARRQIMSIAGDLAGNTIQSPAHGLSAGNQVVFWAEEGAVLPAPLAEGTIYFVIATGLTTDVFEVSTTSGGAAVDITAIGDGAVQTIVPEVFAGQGQYQLSSDTLSLVS